METKKMKKDYKRHIDKKSQVKLFYFNEKIYCQILKQSDDIILVKDIKDWHYDGYMIFPKKFITKVKYSKIEKFREQILEPLEKNDYLDSISIDIENMHDCLKSLQKNNYGICIENANNDKYIFLLGKIMKIKKEQVSLRLLNTFGEYKKNRKIKIDNITCIFFSDEYSRKLFEYADKDYM